ncbi:MAG: hypothetical protein ACPGRZ_07575 [Alphaproteobacteria bacterium]
MKRSSNERISDRLKGGALLFAIVFGILVLSGGPRVTTAETEAATQVIVVDPTNHAWDAY